jgi:hypothetical protein
MVKEPASEAIIIGSIPGRDTISVIKDSSFVFEFFLLNLFFLVNFSTSVLVCRQLVLMLIDELAAVVLLSHSS